MPFERYKFNRRKQEPGETYDQYRTALRKIAECCDFNTITPEEILRDHLLFGIRDNKVRERLLRETKLTLKKTDEICRASESMLAQMKVVDDNAGALINVINQDEREQKFARERGKFKGKHAQPKECGNCGRSHDVSKRESCPAYGKTCRKCGKPNHFAAKCCSRTDNNPRKDVRTVDDECEYDEGEEVFNTYDISTINLDDSQLVTLKLESRNYLRFQPDTGAQRNVIPIDIYKKATKDYRLERVKPANTQLAAYGGSKLTVVGLVRIRVWRGNYKCQLDCKLVDNKAIHPLLGRKACVGMKIIQYVDNDEMNKPQTGSIPVYSLDNTATATKQEVQTTITKEKADRELPQRFR